MRTALALLALTACESKSATPVAKPVPDVAKPVEAKPAPRAPTPDDLPPQPKLGAVAQSGIPADGILIATRTDRHAGPPTYASDDRPDVFLLYRLTRSGLVEVAREEATEVEALAWLDRHTLLVYRETPAHEASLTRVVDGKAGTPTAIPLSAWKLSGAVENLVATLTIAKGGEVWLSRCENRVERDYAGSPCTSPTALRVDAAPFTRANAAPAPDPARHVDPTPGHLRGVALPSLPAPTGYQVELFSVPAAKRQNYMMTYEDGFRCTGPDGKVEWPYGSNWIERQNFPTYRPKAVRWVSAVPPAYVVEGDATNMISRTYHRVDLFHACEPSPVLDAVYLGNDLWAELDVPVGPGPGHGDDPPYVHSTWQIRFTDQPVAVAVGSQAWFAPQPP